MAADKPVIAMDKKEVVRRLLLLESKVIELNERVNGLRHDWNRELMRQHKKKARDDSPAKG